MRALSMRHTVVPTADREAFRGRAREIRDHCKKAGCNYWLFEESDLPGAYVEFFEAPSPPALENAHKTSAHPPSRVYVEIDLT
jgi:hypothetical protein